MCLGSQEKLYIFSCIMRLKFITVPSWNERWKFHLKKLQGTKEIFNYLSEEDIACLRVSSFIRFLCILSKVLNFQ